MPQIKLAYGRVWDTQAAAFAHFREILARYTDEQIVTDAAGRADLLALIQRYVADAFRAFHRVVLLRLVAADPNITMAAQQQRPQVKRPVVLL
jgi:hypothetical protein